MSERLLRVSEVAKRLSISDRMVYQLAKRGDLAAVRIGRCLRFEPMAVAAFLRRASSHSAPQLA